MDSQEEPVSEFWKWANTDRQREVLEAWEAAGRNSVLASQALGVGASNIRTQVARIRARAARQGYAPEHDIRHPSPDGYLVKGNSRLYDKEGNLILHWVKDQIDHEQQREILEGAFAGLAGELSRVPEIPLEVESTPVALCNFYPITDYHLGMLSWERETGEKWDLEIAEEMLVAAFRKMVQRSPSAQKCVIAQMGDYLHSDSLEPVTPTAKHVLDQDSRYAKLAEVACRALRVVIEEALRRHEEVHLILAEGNHDLIGSVWLRVMFAALYEKNPRLTVDQSVLPFYVMEHGETMIGVHHGHLKGITGKSGSDLALIFADMPEWGRTKYRYIHTGHLHSGKEDEVTGAVLMQHPTIAARDAYAARHGWKSMRRMSAIHYHSKWGEDGRAVVTPASLL